MEPSIEEEEKPDCLLRVSDLSIGIDRPDGVLALTDLVSFHLLEGEILG